MKDLIRNRKRGSVLSVKKDVEDEIHFLICALRIKKKEVLYLNT